MLLVVQPWNHWEYLGWLWKNKIILLSSLLHFPHFFSWCSKIQGLLHGLASKKFFPWKLKKKSCRLFDPENLTILYGNKTSPNLTQWLTHLKNSFVLTKWQWLSKSETPIFSFFRLENHNWQEKMAVNWIFQDECSLTTVLLVDSISSRMSNRMGDREYLFK